MDIKKYLHEKQLLVLQALDELMLSPEGDFADHVTCMRYSLFVGGKRVRPILCLAAGACISEEQDIERRLLPVACALECIHTYSLIHDDLPAMDNDDLRRGHPTCHKKFGEAEAILAGDGLLTYAFDLLSNPAHARGLSDSTRLAIVHTVAGAAGSLGMVGGQALDMAGEGKQLSFDQLKTIHRHKTGALITASVLSGALGAGADADQLKAMQVFGDNIGLAFQIVDDLLDVISTTEELGKTAGSDARNNKATYPAFFGVDKTREMAEQAVQRSLDALSMFNRSADPLRALARYIVDRTK
ncbi:MAG: polyprenyl synthetase family protein [Desulfobulbus sp.]|nr:MAG: polyprenyl synthetase family protein [Desulfobulbus sp.]